MGSGGISGFPVNYVHMRKRVHSSGVTGLQPEFVTHGATRHGIARCSHQETLVWKRGAPEWERRLSTGSKVADDSG